MPRSRRSGEFGRVLVTVACVLVAIGRVPALRAQAAAPAFRFTELPAVWGSVAGGTALVEGERLNGGEALGVQLSAGYRFARWGAVELVGSSSQVIGKRTHQTYCTTVNEPIDVFAVSSYAAGQALSCSEAPPVDHVGGVALGIDLFGRSIAGAPRVISVGVGDYKVTGGRHGTYGAGPAVSMRALGIHIRLEQIIARGPDAALSLRFEPLLLPNAGHGPYWSVPLGLALWGW